MTSSLPRLSRRSFHLACASLGLAACAPQGSVPPADRGPGARPTGVEGEGAIADVVRRVAHRQIGQAGPIADGDYARVDSVSRLQAARAPQGVRWTYPWGVTLSGLVRAGAALRDDAVSSFVLEHDRAVARYSSFLGEAQASLAGERQLSTFLASTSLAGLMKLGSLDNTGAMGTQLLDAAARGGSIPGADAVLERVAGWVVSGQPRLPDGILYRPKTPLGPTVWADDLYMGAVFLVRWAAFTKDARHLDDAARQILGVARRLQDGDGLFFHGELLDQRGRCPVKWGRANGWAMLATVETLTALPENHASRAAILAVLEKQVDGLLRVQAPTGAFRQVLDSPSSWEETSCTAMFAYGLARASRRGWIAGSALARAGQAFASVATHVSPEGAIEGTCGGTTIGLDAEHYEARKRPLDDAHGPGPVLLAGAELLS